MGPTALAITYCSCFIPPWTQAAQPPDSPCSSPSFEHCEGTHHEDCLQPKRVRHQGSILCNRLWLWREDAEWCRSQCLGIYQRSCSNCCQEQVHKGGGGMALEAEVNTLYGPEGDQLPEEAHAHL